MVKRSPRPRDRGNAVAILVLGCLIGLVGITLLALSGFGSGLIVGGILLALVAVPAIGVSSARLARARHRPSVAVTVRHASVVPAIAGWTLQPLRGSGDVEVVGEAHYQDALQELADDVDDAHDVTAVLVPEPTNPYDTSAVQVTILHDGRLHQVGHLPAGVAAGYQQQLRPLLEQRILGTVSGKIWGIEQGADVPQVYLRLAPAAEIL